MSSQPSDSVQKVANCGQMEFSSGFHSTLLSPLLPFLSFVFRREFPLRLLDARNLTISFYLNFFFNDVVHSVFVVNIHFEDVKRSVTSFSLYKILHLLLLKATLNITILLEIRVNCAFIFPFSPGTESKVVYIPYSACVKRLPPRASFYLIFITVYILLCRSLYTLPSLKDPETFYSQSKRGPKLRT